MSLDARPTPAPFDPEGGRLPPALEDGPFGGADAPPVLLLVAGPEARATGWAAQAAVALARALSEERSVVLADLGVDRPELHELLGVSNLEGLADVFLFGASLPRVAQPAPGEAFQVVAAGASVPDASDIMYSARWERIAGEYRSGGGTLMAYVPSDAVGMEDLARRVAAAVVLGAVVEVDEIAVALPDPCTVHAVLTPHEDRAEASTAAATGADAIAEPGAGEDAVEIRARAPVEADDLMTPPVIRSSSRKRQASSRLPVLFLILVAVAGWYGYREYVSAPADTAPEAPARSPADPPNRAGAASDPTPRPRGHPVEEELGVSVNVAIYQNYEMARDRMNDLRRGQPDVGFYLSPFEQDGVRYYRLQAGPAAEPEGGRTLLRRLYEAGQVTAVEEYAIRPTSWAFRLSEHDTSAAARDRRRELADQGVPSYVVEIPYSSGPSRYRLYAGAYEYRAEADAMAEILAAAGIQAELVERTGRPTA